MFTVTVGSGDGSTSEVEALTIYGRHGDGGRVDGPPGLAWDDLGQFVDTFWPRGSVSPALAHRILDEASRSDTFLATEPACWSPLGSLDYASFGRFRDNQATWASVERSKGELADGLISAGDPNPDLLFPELYALTDGEVFGAIVFSGDCFIAPLPEAAEFISVDYRPSNDTQSREADAAATVLARRCDGEFHIFIHWRCYFGSNTQVNDGLTKRGQRFKTTVSRRAGAIVGRVVFAIHDIRKPPRRDFTMTRRLAFHESKNADTVASCPELLDDTRVDGDAVIAVHGTMASAIPLARGIRQILEQATVLRFEHDTWLPIADNGDALRRRIEKLNARQVLLIAHSRGGLVACHAAARLTGQNVKVITLGTPFRGTPIVDAVGVGLLGAQALLGLITLMGGPIVDVGTRLAGLFVREVPQGIAAMAPDSDLSRAYLGPISQLIAAAAGKVPPDVNRDTMSFHFQLALSGPAFNGAANDLIVSADSASGGFAKSLYLDCDHFSYVSQPEVTHAISDVAGQWERATLTVLGRRATDRIYWPSEP